MRIRWLQKAVEQPGAPEYLRSDNGSEFIAKRACPKVCVWVTTSSLSDLRNYFHEVVVVGDGEAVGV